jgi:hypothetical protein
MILLGNLYHIGPVMTIKLRWMPFVFVLAVTIPGSALGANPSQMRGFYSCALPPTLAVYHDAIIASRDLASHPDFFKNKHPGSSFNEESWLYALYAIKALSKCTIPLGLEGSRKSLRMVSSAKDILDRYISFTWSPTRLNLAKEWPEIQSDYDNIRRLTGDYSHSLTVPKGVIKTDGKYEAMIHMQMMMRKN